MEIKAYINEMQNIQSTLLEFVDNPWSTDNFTRISNFNFFENLSFETKSDRLKEILYLISKIATNHYRTSDFFTKIEKVLLLFKEDIKQNFSKEEIFNIFKINKRILLFLFNERIINFDDFFSNICELFYQAYFYYENLCLCNEKPLKMDQRNQQAYEEFKANQLIGENDNYICKLIRNDFIEEFVSFVNKSNVPLKSKIKKSIFETNPLLINNDITLIEYAAFFGSIQIFQYLKYNGVELKPSLWKYAIHSNNPQMIHILEENGVIMSAKSSNDFLKYSIKCHHNDIAKYIEENYLNKKSDSKNMRKNIFGMFGMSREPIEPNLDPIFMSVIENYNYAFFKDDLNDYIWKFIKFQYVSIVKILINILKIDVNSKVVLNIIILCGSKLNCVLSDL